MDTQKQLIELMSEHSLTCRDVAEMLGRKKNTVEIWRVKDTKRPPPKKIIVLLENRIRKQIATQNMQ